MPVYRDKDGNIIEEPTEFERDRGRGVKKKKVTGKKTVDERFTAPTKKADGKQRNPGGSPGPKDEGEPHGRSSDGPGERRSSEPEIDSSQTRLVRRASSARQSSSPHSEASSSNASSNAVDEEDVSKLVVGWLVIVSGPGRGLALSIGYGTNNIGRDKTNRIRVDFGDASISRSNHAVLTYDGRGRNFYVQHGGGVNVSYLGDEPVLAPTRLNTGDRLSLGDTEFAFVPFCGPDFDWEDMEADS